MMCDCPCGTPRLTRHHLASHMQPAPWAVVPTDPAMLQLPSHTLARSAASSGAAPPASPCATVSLTLTLTITQTLTRSFIRRGTPRLTVRHRMHAVSTLGCAACAVPLAAGWATSAGIVRARVRVRLNFKVQAR